MGLFVPWFLLGTALIGLPIVLHLLQRHKTTPVPFSSLMFFERRTQSSIKHRKLKYLLLLSLRALLLILVVLAFAQPFVKRSGGAGDDANRRLLVVIDESFSMRAGSRLAEARAEAAKILAGRKGAMPAQVAALGDRLRLLTEMEQDAAKLRAAVESIRGGDSHASYAELTRSLRSVAQGRREPLEVHFISDMQKSAMPVGFSDLQLPENVKLLLHPVANKSEPNWAVESISAPSALWDTKKARVQATVSGFGTVATKRQVTLLAGEKALVTKTVDVPAGGRATVEFQGLEVPYGFSRCQVRIDSADALASDDRLLFAVQRSDPRPVLFVHESRDTRSPPYFRAALGASAEAAFSVEAVTSEATAGQNPARFALVVLSDVLSLPATFSDALKKYVRDGGGVLLAAGPSTSRHPKIPILEASVAESKYYSRAGERYAMVGEADPAHPSLRRAGRWDGVKFYYVVRTDPGKSRVVARLNDRTPLLVEEKIGEGRVLLFASTFDNVANDFPVSPQFVPFVEQTARYLSGLSDRGGSLAVGAHLELRAARERATSIEVIDPDGRRPLSMQEAASAPSYQVEREGFFEVRRANGRHGLVGVNADRKESDLSLVPAETLELWSGAGGTNMANGVGSEHPSEPKPWGVWWYVLVAALAVAAAESALASRYLGVQREERPEGATAKEAA